MKEFNIFTSFVSSESYANKAVKLQPSFETQILKLECLLTKLDYRAVYNLSHDLLTTSFPNSYELLKFKATSSYFLANYEEALRHYHKGHRVAPKHKREHFRHWIRRTEEMILSVLNKPSRKLFDLNNPIFCDKNVLHENYSNLRRHLLTSKGQLLSGNSFDVPVLRNPQIQTCVNIWMLKSLKRRKTKALMDSEK